MASALQLGDRTEQFPAAVAVVRGFDVFVSLPTGYGKSLCFFCLPLAFDKLRRHQRPSIVVVVSPLVALMEDPVRRLEAKGVSTAVVSETQTILPLLCDNSSTSVRQFEAITYSRLMPLKLIRVIVCQSLL